jgi:hypothetical protein
MFERWRQNAKSGYENKVSLGKVEERAKKPRSSARFYSELRSSSQIMKRCFDKLTPIF